MDLSLLTGGAVVGAIIGFWGQIKSFIWGITSIAIQKVDITTEEAHDSIIAYLIKEYKQMHIYDKVYGANNETYRTGKYGLVPYELFGKKNIIFFNKEKKYLFKFPFMFSINKEETKQDENQRYYNDTPKNIYSSILFIRGTINAEQIVANAAHIRNNISWKIDEQEEHSNRFDIFYLPDKNSDNHAYYSKSKNGLTWYKQHQYKLLGIESHELGREKISSGRALDNLFFPDQIKNLIKVIELWVKSEYWFKEKNIPWKRGWLLYGPPGTGKTALVRAFAEDLDMPIYVFSLSQMSNADLIDSWRNLQLNIPCIALIEDIDNVFHGRRNICQNTNLFSAITNSNNESNSNEDESNKRFTPLTFDCLLNCLDGVDKSNGIFTIITTNDITKIDEAIGKPCENRDGFISSRPGRIDKAIELTYMEKKNKIEMAEKILSDFPDKLKEVISYIEKELQETPAQFQEYCAQIAIQEYWSKKEKQNNL